MFAKGKVKSQGLLDLIILFLCCIFSALLVSLFTQQSTPAPSTIQSNQLRSITEITINSQQLTAMNHTLVEIRNILSDIRELMIDQANSDPVQTEAQLYNSYVDEIVEDFYPDLDARYVKAIIYHESRYSPNVVNAKTGVMGLMQISPKWHTKRAEKIGVTNLLDPYGNILVGCDILNELTQKHSFDYAMNFFAGGYPYANRYKGSTSPYVESLTRIIAEMEAGRIDY